MSEHGSINASRGVLITGGSGGLGAHLVRQMVHAGHPVYFTYLHNQADADALVMECTSAGGRCHAIAADVRDESAIAAIVARMDSDGHPVAVLVNNAGITHSAMSWKMSTEQWRETYEVNVTGAFIATRAALPGMRERGFGRVMSISSVVGHRGIPGTAAYAASKAALGGFTRAVASEVASRGITVNCLVLGYFDAGMGRQLPEKMVEKTLQSIPCGRFGDPEKVAKVVAFLATDTCDYITGQEITIDGGFLG